MVVTIRKYVHHRCRNCNTVFKAKDRNYKSTCSNKCAIERWLESIRAMNDKKGPMYKKWLAGTAAARQHREREKGG